MVPKKNAQTGTVGRIYRFLSASWSSIGNLLKIHHYVVKLSLKKKYTSGIFDWAMILFPLARDSLAEMAFPVHSLTICFKEWRGLM
jgi:hypothetical protein